MPPGRKKKKTVKAEPIEQLPVQLEHASDPVVKQKKKRGPKGPRRYTEEYLDKLADEMTAWFMESEKNLFFEKFLVLHDIDPQRLSDEMVKNSPKFAEAVKRLKRLQEIRLAEGLAEGKRNPIGSIFILKNNHDWADKKEIVTHNTSVNVDIQAIKQMPQDQLLQLADKLTRKPDNT